MSNKACESGENESFDTWVSLGLGLVSLRVETEWWWRDWDREMQRLRPRDGESEWPWVLKEWDCEKGENGEQKGREAEMHNQWEYNERVYGFLFKASSSNSAFCTFFFFFYLNFGLIQSRFRLESVGFGRYDMIWPKSAHNRKKKVKNK